eukprot:2610485-Amphidinium_carterae.1
MLSEFKYRLRIRGPIDRYFPNQGVVANCTPEYMNMFLQQMFRAYHRDKFLDDCHMLPQADFIFGRGRQWCTEILNYATLEQDFNNLMQRYGLPPRMSKHTVYNSDVDVCRLDHNAMSPETLHMLHAIYERDFLDLGFSMKQLL